MSEWESEWHSLSNWREVEAWLKNLPPRHPGLWWSVTYTTNTTAPSGAPQTYSDGFDDGWNARGAADGKP